MSETELYDFQQLMLDLRYELTPGLHTYHKCSCGRHPTRRGPCWQCLIEEYHKKAEDK